MRFHTSMIRAAKLAVVAMVVGMGGTGGAGLAWGAAQAGAAGGGLDADRAEIVKMAEGFVAAFGKEDAAGVAGNWLEDGEYTDLSGKKTVGRKAIEGEFAELFKENQGMTARIEVLSMRFPTADTCIEEGVSSVLAADGSPPNRARYTNVLVKKDGKWKLASVTESVYEPKTHYEKLRPLEWAIGEWMEDVKDVKEGHVGLVKFEWTPDGNFMVAKRGVGVKGVVMDNGSQRIGWDPSSQVIRSWNFESDGGFGQSTWTKDGDNRWVIGTSSVLRSGAVLTSITVVNRVDADHITIQATGQILNGKPLPDGPVVKMKRVG